MSRIRRFIAGLLVVSTAATIVPLPAQAAIIATEVLDASTSVSSDRGRIAAALSREDVRVGLAARGVSVTDVQARVDALTDQEAAKLAQQIDSLPAGGAEVLGVLLLVFIILLITDILGVTKVFPFTRSIK